MGSGIAQVRFSFIGLIIFMCESYFITSLFPLQVSAAAGQKVCLVETNDKLLEGANARIHESLKRVAKKVYKVSLYFSCPFCAV